MQKELYEGVLYLSNKIKSAIEEENFDEVENLLQKREILLQNTSKIDENDSEIAQIWAQIKSLDDSNLQEIKNYHQKLGNKLNSLSKNIFAVSSYKMVDNTAISMIDKRN